MPYGQVPFDCQSRFMDQKIDQKYSPNACKIVPSEAQTSSGAPFGFTSASKFRSDSKNSAILEEKLVQNRARTASKSNQIGFQTQSDNLKLIKAASINFFIEFRSPGERKKMDFAYIRLRMLLMMP